MQSVESTHRTATAGAGAVVSALVLALVAIGCGSSSQTPSSLSGVVASDASTASAVTVKDSSTPSQERTAAVDAGGTYKVDVTGLEAPYLVEAKDDDGTALYALATTTGSTNVTGLSDATVRAGSDDEERPYGSYRVRDIEGLIVRLRTVLEPLFQHYGITFGDGQEDSAAYRTMLSEVSFTISNRTLSVKNRATGAVIYSAPLRTLTSGTVNVEAIPSGTSTPAPMPTPTDPTPTPTPTPDPTPTPTPDPTPTPSTCTYTYNAWSACSSSGTQTRTVATASPSGCTGTPVLTQSCTYTPPTCSYTYSTWGACDSTGTQSRTVLSTTPSGCTGTPVLSQSCTYTPPIDGAALYTQYCAGCHGTSKKGSSVSAIQGAISTNRGGMGSLSFLTTEQITAISTAP